MNTENEYIKTAEDDAIYFDPTCDDKLKLTTQKIILM